MRKYISACSNGEIIVLSPFRENLEKPVSRNSALWQILDDQLKNLAGCS